MPASPLRYKKLIRELPNHKTAQALVESAGFSKQTARTQANSVIRSAVRHQARELLNASPNMPVKSRQLMNEILGISSSDLFNRLKWLALENDKDAGTALKILAPLVREHGVILASDEPEKKSPSVLNVIVEQNTTPLIEGNVKEIEENNGSV